MKILKMVSLAATVVATVLGISPAAQAQTLNMAKALDSPHYDSQRTTWSPTSDVTHMIQDTLVALDWDGKTAVPLLAKSWTMSPDGKLYVFGGANSGESLRWERAMLARGYHRNLASAHRPTFVCIRI